MGKNSRQRRKARKAAQFEAEKKQRIEEEKKERHEKAMKLLAEAKSRPLPFQWIPKFHLAARNAMSDYYWRRLSKTLRERADYVCAYCGERHPEPYGTALHEEWNYLIDEDHNGTFELKSLKCVCKKCHNVCHPGASAFFGELDINEIIERYCKINNVDEDTAVNEYILTKQYRDVLATHIKEWKLEDGILDKIENEYGVKCYSKNVQF